MVKKSLFLSLLNKYKMECGVPKKTNDILTLAQKKKLKSYSILPKQPWFSSFCVVMGMGPKERIVSS